MPRVFRTEVWKDWASGRGGADAKLGHWCMPVYDGLNEEWYVWQPNSDSYMVVPDVIYRDWWDSRPKPFKTRYDVEEVPPVPEDATKPD